ncbi:hypothetical protein P7C70_g467, partial [Phenoliferia sp. Uapishka_3]
MSFGRPGNSALAFGAKPPYALFPLEQEMMLTIPSTGAETVAVSHLITMVRFNTSASRPHNFIDMPTPSSGLMERVAWSDLGFQDEEGATPGTGAPKAKAGHEPPSKESVQGKAP